MRTTSSRRLTAGLALAALLGIAGAAPASASITTGSATTRTKDISVGALTAGGGTVSCPAGFRATAGGATWTAVGQSGVELVLLRWLSASLPVQNGKGWFVAGYNGDIAATLHLQVNCLPASVVGTTSVNQQWVDPGGTTPVKATTACGPGKVVVTGGAAWQVQGSPLDASLAQHHRLGSSSPAKSGKAWFGSGNADSADGVKLRVVAYCRSSAGVGTYTIRFKEINVIGTNIAFVFFFGDGGKQCPSGRVVTGGAYWQNPFAPGGKAPVADGILGRSIGTGKTGWSATATPGATVDRQLVVVVLCRP